MQLTLFLINKNVQDLSKKVATLGRERSVRKISGVSTPLEGVRLERDGN